MILPLSSVESSLKLSSKIASFILIFSLNALFAQNRALNFDGVDDYIPITGSSSLSPSKITCEMFAGIACKLAIKIFPISS